MPALYLAILKWKFLIHRMWEFFCDDHIKLPENWRNINNNVAKGMSFVLDFQKD
uniref:Uncharacterized protein n=1 Tax=Lepeophtheirus salmonis TaxID=72036 RepID=A0A0K2V0C8_LEPSM